MRVRSILIDLVASQIKASQILAQTLMLMTAKVLSLRLFIYKCIDPVS